MKLDLDRRDYRALLTVLEIADWVLHAFRADEPPETARLRALEQKVLALAERFGCAELVEYDAEGQRWWFSRTFDETSDALEFIDQFENDSFWEQLSDRLVERDLIRQIGEAAIRRLDPEELAQREEPYRTLYADEFMRHGVERLEILPAQDGSGAPGSRLS